MRREFALGAALTHPARRDRVIDRITTDRIDQYPERHLVRPYRDICAHGRRSQQAHWTHRAHHAESPPKTLVTRPLAPPATGLQDTRPT